MIKHLYQTCPLTKCCACHASCRDCTGCSINYYVICWWFLTCQVRVVRFYVSCLAPSPPRLLNWERRMAASAAFPAKPQLRSPDGSMPRRASTASSGWQRPRRTSIASSGRPSTASYNRQFRTAVFPAGPQPPALKGTVPRRKNVRRYAGKNVRQDTKKVEGMTERMSEDMPERMSEDMPKRMSENLQEDMSERMSCSIACKLGVDWT